MSSSPTRELAVRVFADEYDDVAKTFKESDEERAPTYALLPSGAKANRVLIVGTLTEKEDVGNEDEYWRGRVTDPTGGVNVYAGQYEPEAAEVLRDAEPPRYVAVVGKPRTYETDDGDIRSTIRPESITLLDAGSDDDVAETVRDMWIQETAELTLDRLDSDGEYAEMAEEEYGDRNYIANGVEEALESLDDN